MTENIKTGAAEARTDWRALVSAFAYHIFWGLAGFAAARGQTSSTLAPFGLALCAGTATNYVPATAIGAAIGYFIPVTGAGVFRYLAAICAIAAIRLVIGSFFDADKHPVWKLIIGFSVTFATSVAVGTITEQILLDAAAEGILAGVGTYFIALLCRAVSLGVDGLKDDELAGAAIFYNIILLSLMPIIIKDVSIGRLLIVTCILVVAKYGRAEVGALCGIISSLFLALCSPGFSEGVLIYSLSGIACGIAARRGRVIQAVAFVVAAGFSVIFFGESEKAVLLLIESFFGAALFLLVPDSVCVQAGKLFSAPTSSVSPIGLKNALTMRLSFASGALSEISQTVDKVAKELSRINTPEHADVMLKIEQDACAGCRMHGSCWDSSRCKTVDAVRSMGAAVVSGVGKDATAMPEELREFCIRRERVEDAVYRHYFDFISKIEAERRVKDVRDIVSDQFNGISQMLKDLSDEFEKDEVYDEKLASELSSALKNIGVRTLECGCRTDRFDRMQVEMRVRTGKNVMLNKMRILNIAESVCCREFEPPVVNNAGEEVLIHLSERPEYRVSIGISQINSAGATVCGDAYNCFYDGRGNYVMVLSDGMGTGGRAAVDSAMASGLMSRLLKAGFGYDCSLKLLNSSMLFKSTDESLATVDIASIDLFSGKTNLFKAGAAPTLVVRSGRTGRAVSTSLPAGIIREVAFDKATIVLKPGDLIMMMSDGVTANGTEWICEELNEFDGNIQGFADKIANMASKRRDDGRADDITVIVAVLDRVI